MRPTLGIKISMGHLSILQKCLVISVLFHLLLVLLFSGVVVTQQIVQYVRRNEPMVPLVNLQLSREMEVRTQTRQQITALPMPEPSVIHAAQPMVHIPSLEPPLAIAPARRRAAAANGDFVTDDSSNTHIADARRIYRRYRWRWWPR